MKKRSLSNGVECLCKYDHVDDGHVVLIGKFNIKMKTVANRYSSRLSSLNMLDRFWYWLKKISTTIILNLEMANMVLLSKVTEVTR